MSEARVPVVLTIAGSDSGGGAGIEADLKAFAAAGVHGTCAITAVTAQNTLGVEAIHAVPAEIVVAQARAVVDDIGVDAVKVGMLGTRETIEAVAVALDLVGEVPVVVDPVMVSESGAELLQLDAAEALVGTILPRAEVLTPNLPEARRLTGLEEATPADLARAIRELGAAAVVVTGGHADGADLLDDGKGEPLRIPGEMHPDGAAHGSGCTQARRSRRCSRSATRCATLRSRRARVAGDAIANGLREIGAGPGPVDALGIAGRSQRRRPSEPLP